VTGHGKEGLLNSSLSRKRERVGVRPKPKVTPWPVALWPVDIMMAFPLTVAFPASGSRHPYLYIGERERHPVLPDLCKAVRDSILSPKRLCRNFMLAPNIPSPLSKGRRWRMRGYNKNNNLYAFSWSPHPLPLPIDMGRGKYLNYDTVSKGRGGHQELFLNNAAASAG
jgi:hypothetical protein